MNVLTENRVNRRTGQVERAVTHVGCAHCGLAIPVTNLHYWRAEKATSKIEYYCSAAHSLDAHNAREAHAAYMREHYDGTNDRRSNVERRERRTSERRSGKGTGMRRIAQRRQAVQTAGATSAGANVVAILRTRGEA